MGGTVMKAPGRTDEPGGARAKDAGGRVQGRAPGVSAEGRSQRMFLKVGRDGRVLIPAAIREAMKLEPGGEVMAWLEDGALRLLSPKMGMEQAQEAVCRIIGKDVRLVDELIAERRAEARGESETEGLDG